MLQNQKILIFTDGGARGNPGPAGIGIVIKNGDSETGNEILLEYSEFIGKTTNNQAEYRALISALQKAQKLALAKDAEIECYLDSELVVKQLNREYRVKDADLAPLFVKVWNLKQSFKKIGFFHIPREKNKMADRLVNEALDKALGV